MITIDPERRSYNLFFQYFQPSWTVQFILNNGIQGICYIKDSLKRKKSISQDYEASYTFGPVRTDWIVHV